MPLYDGAADGQPDPHAAGLGAEERFEELVDELGVHSHARVLHRQQYPASRDLPGADDQPPGTSINLPHRVRSIAEPVDDDLLELDTIAS